jgi:hypothetical protein
MAKPTVTLYRPIGQTEDVEERNDDIAGTIKVISEHSEKTNA